MKYTFLDSGNGQKLEQFGDYLIARPCSQALWQPLLSKQVWEQADATFTREGGNQWIIRNKLPDFWLIDIENIRFKVAPTDFGHLGVFPEHQLLWKWMAEKIKKSKRPPKVLNLFAYSGAATLAAAQAGAEVCHLDASKGMVSWARENAALNDLKEAPVRWLVDDVIKFLAREQRRGNQYDGIILDPPSFGRGGQGEVFKIERDIQPLLAQCHSLLSRDPLFFILSTHTPGMTPLVLSHLLHQAMGSVPRNIESGEMILSSKGAMDLPCGSFARWERHD